MLKGHIQPAMTSKKVKWHTRWAHLSTVIKFNTVVIFSLYIAIFCGACLSWIHKKCSGIKGPLCPDPDFRCARCLGKARPIDGRLVKEVQVDDETVEAVPEFCYLGDMLSAGGGCELAAVTRCKSAWGKF